ncbi:hypothetical protein G4B88_000948 [Cannabis sativa]|uniref:F-box domain-containing protein n=1 Tax=Cannabis sativa TaxID=3483 RepID=A0A7J6E1Q0_CANSA|nr:hypothetical protein G4B88_000948 [Cannabis sativa]
MMKSTKRIIAKVTEKIKTEPKEYCVVPKESINDILNNRILVEIFVRINDFRSLVQCRLVCKYWFSLINSNQYRQRKIIYHYNTQSKSPVTLLFGNSYRHLRFDEIPFFRFLTPESRVLHGKSSKTNFQNLINFLVSPSTAWKANYYLNFLPPQKLFLLSSLDDLLLLFCSSKKHTHFLICNPLTRQWIQLPIFPLTSQECKRCLALEGSGGLVRDSTRSVIRYKIIVLWYNKNNEGRRRRSNREEYTAMTFCFHTRKWSRSNFFLIGKKLDDENYISCNGMVHWLETKNDLITKRAYRIIAIDPFKYPNHPKYFRYFNFPPDLDTSILDTIQGRLTVRIGVVRGRLRLSQLNLVGRKSFLLKVWEFNYDPHSSDEDEKSSLKWSLVHKVEEVKWKASHHLSVAAFHGDNENIIFLLRNSYIIYQYDILRNETTKIGQFISEEHRSTSYLFYWKLQVYTILHPPVPTPLPLSLA